MALTKKAKLEKFDALQREHDLLQRYFWDSRIDFPFDAQVRVASQIDKRDVCVFTVYGTQRADGGYIIIEWQPGGPARTDRRR